MYITGAVIQKYSVKKVCLEISQNSQENTCARVTLLKMGLWHRCFPVNFVKFLGTPFYIEYVWWLLLNLHITYPPPIFPPYQRLIWDYKKAGTSNIREKLDFINWQKLFSHKGINAQVTVFNEIILNIFRKYVLNKYITFDDKDPVWMNENIKSKIKSKNLL